MMLATRDDLEYPSIDWECRTCGVVYVSRGEPDDNRCLNGHDAGWIPEDDQMEEYIDTLKSLEEGDGVLFAGRGPAPLMGPIKKKREGYIITESIDSPERKIWWDEDALEIYQSQHNKEYPTRDRVHHIDTVEIDGGNNA